MAKEDQIDHQEMERKKVLALKENLISEINQNLLAKEDQIDHQEMVRKKVLALKENLILLKKIIQDQLVLQIIQNTLEKKHLKIHQIVKTKETLDLKGKRNLKVELIDLKALHLKDTVKRE